MLCTQMLSPDIDGTPSIKIVPFSFYFLLLLGSKKKKNLMK